MQYILCREKQSTSYDQGGFEADPSACGAGAVSEANDSEGGRAWESCCAMNKERVNCNGCEKVSTLSEAKRDLKPSLE
jgi:hypothetical protein